jgi:hypothetical protein
MDAPAWEALSLIEREAFLAECRAYDELLAEAGHVVAREALEREENGATLRIRHGGATIEPGCLAAAYQTPLRGILVIDATDMNHAIQLLSRHPAVRRGAVVEVRPAATAGRIDAGEKSLKKPKSVVETGRSPSTN